MYSFADFWSDLSKSPLEQLHNLEIVKMAVNKMSQTPENELLSDAPERDSPSLALQSENQKQRLERRSIYQK